MSEIVVLKHGSSVVENPNGIGIDQESVNHHVAQHALLREEGFSTLEVASGAVVAGKEYVLEMGRQIDVYDSRALAKFGTPRQMKHWIDAGRLLDIMVCQVLATHEEIDSESEGTAIIEGMLSDLEQGNLPVLNENNAAAEVELDEYDKIESEKAEGEDDTGADNDWLAVHTALSTGADAVLLLTGADGFRVNGRVVPEIRVYDIPEMLEYCEASSKSGSGGMKSKLLAAGKGARKGLHVVIGSAFEDCRDVLNGQGTTVVQ